MKMGCKANFLVSYHFRHDVLMVMKSNLQHNHPTNPQTYAMQRKQKRLTDEEQESIREIVNVMNPSNENLMKMINSTYGKCYSLQEIRKFKHRLKSSRPINIKPEKHFLELSQDQADFHELDYAEIQDEVKEEESFYEERASNGSPCKTVVVNKSKPPKPKSTSQPNKSYEKDNCDLFAQTVAHDLRSLSKDQRIHAKKLISEVIYEGSLGSLSRASCVVTEAGSTNPQPLTFAQTCPPASIPYTITLTDPFADSTTTTTAPTSPCSNEHCNSTTNEINIGVYNAV